MHEFIGWCVLALLLGLGVFHPTIAGQPDERSLSLDCQSPPLTVMLPDFGSALTMTWSEDAAGELSVEERGVDAVITDSDAATTLVFDAPPRLGMQFLLLRHGQSIHVSRFRNGGMPGDVRIVVDCAGRFSRPWLTRARDAAARAMPRGASASAQTTLEEWDQLATSAPSAWTRALAIHLSAQAAFRAGESRRAYECFVEAERSWLAAADPARSLAARVAQVDELQRLGEHEKAMTVATPVSTSILDASPYYSQRLYVSRCLSWRYANRLAQADACFESAIEMLKQHGERAEAASALQDHADVLVARGRTGLAIERNNQSLALAQGPDVAILRGRAYLSLSAIRLGDADVAGSMRDIERALEEFGSVGAFRWEANALLRVANLYTALGATMDARNAVTEAMARLSETDAPARIAATAVTLARIDLQEGFWDEAGTSLDKASGIYSRLGMGPESDIVRVEKLRLAVLRHDHGGIDRLRALPWSTKAVDADRDLALASAFLDRGDLPSVRQALARSQQFTQSLAQRIEQGRLQAGVELASGHYRAVHLSLVDTRKGLRRIAARVRNPILRSVLSHRIQDLGRLDIERIYRQRMSKPFTPYTQADVQDVWDWMSGAALDDGSGKAGSSDDIASFDRAMAAEVSGPARVGRADLQIARRLLAALSQEGADDSRPASPLTLEQLQRSLHDGDLFLAHADASDRGMLLSVTHQHAQLFDVAGGHDLAPIIHRLLDGVSSAQGSVASIEADSQQLAIALNLQSQGAAPARLIVHRDGILGGIPWNLMMWPGTEQPLIVSTSVRVAPLTPFRESDQWQLPTAMTILVADGNGANWPQLHNAVEEPQLIQAAFVPRSAPTISTVAAASRHDVIAAFSTPGHWVHVASHGISQKGRLGRSGLLLSSQGIDKAPDFVSWLDVAAATNSASMVVLDACETGSGYDVAASNLGFAAGLSRSGVSQVIAALWPVSDSAMAIWVPAFYGKLSADPQRRPAEAMRFAALQLRERRRFRHPFYWASFVVLERRGTEPLASVQR